MHQRPLRDPPRLILVFPDRQSAALAPSTSLSELHALEAKLAKQPLQLRPKPLHDPIHFDNLSPPSASLVLILVLVGEAAKEERLFGELGRDALDGAKSGDETCEDGCG